MSRRTADDRKKIVEILDKSIIPPDGVKPFTYGLAVGLIADEILAIGHKCPWNKSCTCYLHYECNGCETYAEAMYIKTEYKK